MQQTIVFIIMYNHDAAAADDDGGDDDDAHDDDDDDDDDDADADADAAAAADDDDDDGGGDDDDDDDGDDYDHHHHHHHHHHQHHHKFHKQCKYNIYIQVCILHFFKEVVYCYLLEIRSFRIGNQHALFVAFSCPERSTYVKLAWISVVAWIYLHDMYVYIYKYIYTYKNTRLWFQTFLFGPYLERRGILTNIFSWIETTT